MVIQLNQPEVPQRLHGVTLVDRHGLPRFWANVWALMALADHAELTRLRKLHHVERLYAYADGMLGAGALDDALADLDDARLGTILEGWFVSLRNQARPTASDQERWRAGLEFVVMVSTWLGQGMARDDRLVLLNARWQRLHLLYSQLQIYARAVFEDRLSAVWNNVFDDRVAVLRALPPGDRDASAR